MKTLVTYLKGGKTKLVPAHHAKILEDLKLVTIQKPEPEKLKYSTKQKIPAKISDVDLSEDKTAQEGADNTYSRRDMIAETSGNKKSQKQSSKKENQQ